MCKETSKCVADLLKNAICSDYDGKPIKNRLSTELIKNFKTENQWLDAGMRVKENAVGIEMHSHVMGKKLYRYYHITDVEPIPAGVEICATCGLRKADRGKCLIKQEFVSPKGHCSEWDGHKY